MGRRILRGRGAGQSSSSLDNMVAKVGEMGASFDGRWRCMVVMIMFVRGRRRWGER